jgi:acetyl-CoA acetyltransferase
MVAGIGITTFGKHFERSLVSLGTEAAHTALKDAGMKPSQVDACFFSNVLGCYLFGDATIGQNIFWEVGINRVPVVNVENACASSSTAFYLACNMVAAGQADVVLVVGAEKMWVLEIGLLSSGKNELDTLLGLSAPASFAMRAIRHMAEFGTTREQLAAVAVKNRRHAQSNTLAQYRKPTSVPEVLASAMIVDPLTKLMCCPIADGAAAAVVCSPSVAKGLSRSVKVEASVLCSGNYENPQDIVRWETDYRGCRLAYEKAGTGPEDLNVVECHDAFSISEIMHYEALGLCPEGEGGRYITEGNAELGGRTPVNTSGGLLSRGHPLGATGLAQIGEIVIQLRGEAGPRQVNGARVGLAHCMGGDKAGDTKNCTVVILSK